MFAARAWCLRPAEGQTCTHKYTHRHTDTRSEQMDADVTNQCGFSSLVL